MVLGLVFYCVACWTVVAVVADGLYQFASPPQASAANERVTGGDHTAR